PRLRPAPFAMDWHYSSNNQPEREATAIDTFNHNDNNWWCKYDEEHYNQKIDDAALVTLETNRREYTTRWLFHGINDLIPNVSESVQASEASFIQKQQEQLAKHPFHKLVDQKE